MSRKCSSLSSTPRNFDLVDLQKRNVKKWRETQGAEKRKKFKNSRNLGFAKADCKDSQPPKKVYRLGNNSANKPKLVSKNWGKRLRLNLNLSFSFPDSKSLAFSRYCDAFFMHVYTTHHAPGPPTALLFNLWPPMPSLQFSDPINSPLWNRIFMNWSVCFICIVSNMI